MAKIKRSSFVFYESFYDSIELLGREVQAEILVALIRYGLRGEIDPNLKPVANALFVSFKAQIDSNNTKYLNGIKGAEHGIKGGRPKGKITPRKPLNNPKKTPNDNVNENVNENDNVNENVNTATACEFFFISNERIDQSLKDYVDQNKTYFIESFLTSNGLASIFDKQKFFELLTKQYPNGSSFNATQHLDNVIKKIILENFKKREIKMVY